jgi:hypothetical protein
MVEEPSGSKRGDLPAEALAFLKLQGAVSVYWGNRREDGPMTVISTTVSRAKPGRANDAVAMAVEAAKLLQRHGARDCRLLLAGAAGEATGTQVFSCEFENNEAYGVWADKLAGDAETEAFVARLNAEDSPITVQTQSLGIEIPLNRSAKGGHGKIVEAFVSRLVPGRFEAALDFAGTVFDFLERYDAVNCRLMQLVTAGTLTEAFVVSWEFDSMQALGRAGDAYMTDPDGQAIFQVLTGPSAPTTTITSGIYTDIPL